MRSFFDVLGAKISTQEIWGAQYNLQKSECYMFWVWLLPLSPEPESVSAVESE